MKEFILRADIIFEANDIDDAFKRLASHFEALANDEDSSLGIVKFGEIEIKKKDE